ncbi:FG-GAP-like repeat-containing protein [Streptomyces sp. NPDC001276]|uniref:FG-GAP-like repeat-containing protein n=1 Tax=Streptomyces sp. NPDC001276 TaxID=3364555 RepID=UPI0036A70130
MRRAAQLPRHGRTVGRALATAFLALSTVLTAVPPSTAADAPPDASAMAGTLAAAGSPPASDFFSTVAVDPAATVGAPAAGDNRNHGDLWPNCWSDDDNVYTAYGDGVGFGGDYSDIGVAKISGMPGGLTGSQLSTDVGQIWSAGHNRKPTGMACVNGDLYLAVQDLATDFNDVPAATIAKSTDKGRTWTWDRNRPMFGGGVFTTVMFLDYGKNYANAPDDYVYAYGLDHNWRDSFDNTVPDPVDLYLARVHKNSVMDENAWQYMSGTDASGNPVWSTDISRRKPALHDDRRVYQNVLTPGRARDMTILSQGGVVYNKPLNRYIYTSWTEYTFEFYESPNPWGPWKHFATKDFGGYTWTHTKHGGYATTIPSKYISADGKSMWLQSNVCPCGGGYPYGDHWAYTFSLRKLSLEQRRDTTPGNAADPKRNLAREPGTVPVQRATHFGKDAFYADGNRDQNEDDWNDERKDASWWGYTWPRQYMMNKVTYTTGDMFADGGWFAGDLRVQVRRDNQWMDVSGQRVGPAYPYDNSAGAHRTYTFTFDPAAGDGVRIIGRPGGGATFTSIAELEVHYANAGGVMLGGSPTDVNGDGKDDIITFTRNAAADVYASVSDGTAFTGGGKWNDYFALAGETPLTGDFTGDGKDDAVTFTHGTAADVYVAPSSGSSFGTSQKWNDHFAPGSEVPAVGDFNGDGKDDIVTFTQDDTSDVYVALSTGTSFGTGAKWHDHFAPAGEFPAVGDVNGDGKDDIITFTKNAAADVYVALSTGDSFATARKVLSGFSPGAQLPRVGDFNGDGKDDIASFTADAAADVRVALSNGDGFTDKGVWHDSASGPGAYPYVGDYDGDGKDDIVSFSHTPEADVHVALSSGTAFGDRKKWNDFFGLPGETSI